MTVIETQRLRLRQMSLNDLDDLHSIFSDPIAMEYYPQPFDREMTRGWIDWSLRSYAENGFGLWAVEYKEDGCLIGDCGLSIQRVDGVSELEIGYHIMRTYWKHGLATEGAIACRDHAFDNLRRERVISWMRADHLASRRVAEKTGMRLEKEIRGEDGTVSVVYSMTPGDRHAVEA